MDKKLMLAVAGAGKTTFLVDSLDDQKRTLIVTYTVNNYNNLRRKIIKKFNGIPSNIRLLTFFEFIYTFCYKPQLSLKIKARGLTFDRPPDWTNKIKRTDISYYRSNSGRLYHNRISLLILNNSSINDTVDRLERFYDRLLIDEVQDIAGHDFNLLMAICVAKVELLFVGDFHQHTFDTSRDGATRKGLHKDYEKYIKEFGQQGILVDTKTLVKSHRCSPTVCQFISDKLGVNIESEKKSESNVEIIEDSAKVQQLFADSNVIKLFYQNSSKFNCYARNWGECKGENHYNDVCVVLNKKSKGHLKGGKLSELPAGTLNKLYVACSRANGNLYITFDDLIPSEFIVE